MASNASRTLGFCALLLATGAACAQGGDSSARERLRNTGPVTITADNADWAKSGTMVYSGNVKLESDTLKLDGDRLELKQHDAGQFEAKIDGGPAHLAHGGVKNENGEVEPPVTARAKNLIYDSRSGIIEVVGDARLTRGADEITGDTIRYNVNERRIQAAGGTGGRVRIVIQPPEQGADGKKVKP